MVDQGMKVIKEAAMVKLLGSEVYNRVAGYSCSDPWWNWLYRRIPN